MNTEERKLAAIVFTDIVGFTELMGKNEKSAMALLEKQKRLLRPIIENFQGEWLKEMGDGTLSSFPSAVLAVTCALEIQRILEHDAKLTVRVGIHIGDVIKKDGDVFGDGVNIASRLEPLAEPGGICVSERVYEDIRNKPEINSAFQDEQILKGLDRPIKVYSVFTKMGTAPAEKSDQNKPKPHKSKIPYIIAGVVIGLLVTVFALKQSSPLAKNSLAIFNFENLFAESENDRIGQILQELIITDLSGITDLKVFSSQRLFDIQKQMGSKELRHIDQSMAMDIARGAGARSMLTGNIIKVGNTVVLTSRLLDVEDGSVINSRKVEGEDIYTMVDQLSSLVTQDLNLGKIETVDLAISKKTSSNMTAYSHFIAGNDLLNRSNFNQAVLELKEAVAMDPTFKKALYKLAIAQWWAKGGEVASSDTATIATLDKYLALPNLSDNEIKVGRGVKNIILNRYADALDTFEYLVELHPDDKEYQYLLGECYFHGTDSPLRALRSFEEAINLDPDFDLANIHIIDLYILEKQYDKTILMIEKELQKNPKSIRSLSNLGMIKGLQGKSKEGFEIANKVLSIDPEHFGAKFWQIRMLFELGMFDEAEPLINDLHNEYLGRIDVFMLKNGFYFLQGKYSELRRILQKGINETSTGQLTKRDSIKIQTYARSILLGDCLSTNKEYLKEDVKLFSNINDPNIGVFTDFLYLMAWSHLKLGDFKEFENIQKRTQSLIVEKELSNSWQKEYLTALKLDAYFYKKNWSKVIKEYRMFGSNINGQLFRQFLIQKKCEAEFQLKKYDLALVTAKKMISPDQDYRTFANNRPFGYYWQGRIYEELGKPGEAVYSYEKLMKLWENGDENIPVRQNTIQRLKKLKKTA